MFPPYFGGMPPYHLGRGSMNYHPGPIWVNPPPGANAAPEPTAVPSGTTAPATQAEEQTPSPPRPSHDTSRPSSARDAGPSPRVDVPDSDDSGDEQQQSQQQQQQQQQSPARPTTPQRAAVARPLIPAKVVIVFHSPYGSVARMAQAVASGVREVRGATVQLFQVPELLDNEALDKFGYKASKDEFSHIPVLTLTKLHVLEQADAIIFGFSPSFGVMSAEMKSFMEWWGQLWIRGALVGKIASVFTAASTQQAGQELAIISTIASLLHHGMLIAGLPDVSLGQPYGATTAFNPESERTPTPRELEAARSQGRHVAQMAVRLCQTPLETNFVK